MHERRRHLNAEITISSSTGISVPPPTTGSKFPRRVVRRKRSHVGRAYGSYELGLWSSRALLLLVAGIYSTNYASVKYLETLCVKQPCDHDPAEIVFCRFFVSALVCLPILFVNRKHVPLIKAGVECGLSISINYICQAKSLKLIPAGKCCFIATLNVAVIPIFNWIFLGRPLKRITLISAGTALIGVAILENLFPTSFFSWRGEDVNETTQVNDALYYGLSQGDLLALGQPIGFGYSVMRLDYYLEKYSYMPNRVQTITAAQCVVVCVVTLLWVLCDNKGAMPDLSYMFDSNHLMTLAWTGIITSVGAIILQGIALNKASATDAALIFCTEPVIASLFAGWLLHETPGKSTYTGGAVIIGACVMGTFADRSGDTTKSTRSLPSKSSGLSEDSLLPTRMRSMLESMSTSKSDGMVKSIMEIPDFPTGSTSKVNSLM